MQLPPTPRPDVAIRLIVAFVLGTGPLPAQELSATAPPPPALRELVRRAVEDSPRVQAARAAVDAAAARERAASRPLYNPELGIETERAETDTLSLGISQTIDWADKREARTEVAGNDLAARRAELEAVRQEVAGELLSALGRFETARSLQALAQRRAALMQRFLALAEQRRRAGDLNQVELDLARLAATQAELRKAQADAEVAEAQRGLAAVAGERRGTWPALPQELPAIGTFDADALLADLPAMRAQQARIAAARAAVELRDRERRPDPTVGLRAGQERAFRGDDEAFAAVGLTLSIPLFVRNDFRAEVDAAGADLLQAERQARDLHRRARARLESAAQRYRLARHAWRLWTRAGRPSIERRAELLERIWRAGEISTTDYLVQLEQTLDTRAEALGVRGRLLDAWFEWLVASARIGDWLGGTAP